MPLEEGDYYVNEQGYKVFTEKYHLKRGHCCKSGCKHCPYGYDKKTDSFFAVIFKTFLAFFFKKGFLHKGIKIHTCINKSAYQY